MTDELVIAARRALLDALEALGDQAESIILVGAQAIYLHTGSAEVAIAEFTTDADLAIDPRALQDDPLIEAAMTAAGFTRGTTNPGVWISRDGVQVDLMVPALVAGKGRRSVDAPPHDPHSMRKSAGLEAALVDRELRRISSFEPEDQRSFSTLVAGPAALLIAKLHKLGERVDQRRALDNKDAHDIYRILIAIETDVLARSIEALRADETCSEVVTVALQHLGAYFAADVSSAGNTMAGAAEAELGDPAQVAASTHLLAVDLFEALSDDD
ncbi:hypothetical protein [Schumannella sp. 10F1B-5-1]|uniref:hypothetical protein n=1 Tax=Schumannella sp. 10F1B-5-1 TaxID=2590780 RepID=UPI001130CC86|nr:hypothetical protein [Schumannella sp. 10F1B-5-1]TPW71595.1 hypothetical protein FJ658_09550 [Schumannella sp. 10F1B-5-1]